LVSQLEKNTVPAAEVRRLSDQVGSAAKNIDVLQRRLETVDQRQRTDQRDVHGYLIAQTFGLDLASLPLTRYIPIRVYLSDADPVTVARVSDVVEHLADAAGFEVADEFPAEKGSWWKRWFGRTKEALTQPQVIERLEKVERAAELRGLGKPQAEADKLTADAVSTLLKSVEKVPDAAMQVGSVLILKTTPQNGPACVQVRTLSQRQMIWLEKNVDLLKSPDNVLARLAEVEEVQQPAIGDGKITGQRETAAGSAVVPK
jgi:hypothetical protein